MNIILAPVITEKSESLKSNNVYVFKVSPKANKTQIKNEVEKQFIKNYKKNLDNKTSRRDFKTKIKFLCVRNHQNPYQFQRVGRLSLMSTSHILKIQSAQFCLHHVR